MDPFRNPSENVRMLAEHKALHVAEQLRIQAERDGADALQAFAKQRAVIIGADTTVAIGSEVLNKPLDEADAERMLRKLSGQTHTVYTGVALVRSGTNEMTSFVESTDVTFRNLGIEEIRQYIATGAPMDKAGAYGIQEDFGAVFVRQIDGDYYNVVGLPICRLYVELRQFEPGLFARAV
jgi:septum formation protein